MCYVVVLLVTSRFQIVSTSLEYPVKLSIRPKHRIAQTLFAGLVCDVRLCDRPPRRRRAVDDAAGISSCAELLQRGSW